MQRRLETEESGILVILALIVTTKLISVCQLESRFEKINASMRKLALGSPLARALHFFWSPLVGAHRWRPLGIGLWASASGAYASGHRPLWRTPLSIGFWGCPAAAVSSGRRRCRLGRWGSERARAARGRAYASGHRPLGMGFSSWHRPPGIGVYSEHSIV